MIPLHPLRNYLVKAGIASEAPLSPESSAISNHYQQPWVILSKTPHLEMIILSDTHLLQHFEIHTIAPIRLMVPNI